MTTPIQRYWLDAFDADGASMQPAPDGDWIRWSDLAGLVEAARHIAYGKIPSECEVEDPSGYLIGIARAALARFTPDESRP